MRILLVGEYSRLHNSLKEALEVLGHEVKIIGTGDSFKQFPVDILLNEKYQTGWRKKFKVLWYKLFKIDLGSRALLKQFMRHKNLLKNYDVVQLINEKALGMQTKDEIKVIDFLKKNNKKIFLLSCGTDYTSVSYAIENKIRYSIFTPYIEGRLAKSHYTFSLKYLDKAHKTLHDYLFQEIIDGVIASDMDYHIPLEGNPKYLGLIANPINVDTLPYTRLKAEEPIEIFLGINRGNYLQKGVDFFEIALEFIQEKYGNRVRITAVENLPYKEYIKKYDAAHILLDQVYSFDQGYNALEAMAKGKVVFTGAETELLNLYHIKEDEVCINAMADVDYLVEKLSWLIENPQEIEKISQQARDFIEREHHYIKTAQIYLDKWFNN